MGRNNLEDLFRDKLDGLVIEPSDVAREKFTRKIQYKRRSVLLKRFSIAASILLFVFAGIYSFSILNTSKIDLSKGQAFDSGYEFEIADLKNVPSPRTITPVQSEDFITENAKAFKLRNSTTGIQGINQNVNLASRAQGDEGLEMDPEIDGLAGTDQGHGELIAAKETQSTYIEYFVPDPDLVVDDQGEEVTKVDREREPMKITIEYIASGEKGRQSESKRSNFYSKLDNMKTMDEVLGDIRTYKDKLFAFDFRKEEKVNNNEKSTE